MTLNVRDRERILQQNRARQEGWIRWSTPFRYIAFLVIVISIISGLWFLIAESSEPTPKASLQTVLPDEEPYKVKVDEQEILSVRHQDKLVYSRIYNGNDVPKVEHILPDPETPVIIEAGGQPSDNPVEVVIEEIPSEDEVNSIAELVEDASIPDDSQVESVSQSGNIKGNIKEATAEPTLDSIASLISQTEVDKPSGSFVQLATLDSQEQAQQEWKRLKGKYKDILTQESPLIEQVDLGEKGIRYRLRVGPYGKLDDAKSAAEALKAQKVGCIVIP